MVRKIKFMVVRVRNMDDGVGAVAVTVRRTALEMLMVER
jgi:hypothetical protein